MTKIESYIAEVESLLAYKDYNQLIKKLIDLALDTENVKHYRDMVNHLDWLDNAPNQTEKEIYERSEALFLSLKDALLRKSVSLQEKTTPILNVTNLTKKYEKGFFCLGPINLELFENEMLGLVGENGNGKTTLLRILAKELKVSYGTIKYNFDYEDDYDLRAKLIFIPQRTPVWQGGLLENLQFTAASYGVKGEENELKVELIVARMGIRKYRNFAWAGLSSGYKMRFELARALLRNPKVMLIDEPLANLDILAQKSVLDDLKGICASPFRPMGIMLSSQQLYEVEKNANDVIFLKEGVQKNLQNKLLEKNQSPDFDTVQKPETSYMLEFETPWEMAVVREGMKSLHYLDIKINGGTFVITLPIEVNQHSFLQHVLNIQMPLTYFRDISKSTRRFFLS